MLLTEICKYYVTNFRYHERYYPESIYTDDRQEYEEDRVQVRQHVGIFIFISLNILNF